MTTYTQEGIEISPVKVTATRVPITDDMPTVTVRASFDWKFWAGIAGIAAGLYIFRKSLGFVEPKRMSRRLR